ncbi:hypothetical protein, partial [Actinophytocola sp.]|uniref:hypothetical protein n=1 Tax=Actinophytocola sp. TaxID=1872138 RepID=UPI002D7F5B36
MKPLPWRRVLAALACVAVAATLPAVLGRTAVASVPTPQIGALRGNLELVERFGAARGWAQERGVADLPVEVLFYVDGPIGSGSFAGGTVADLPYPGIGDHGFAFVLP